MNQTFIKVLFWIGYAIAAAVVGCLVVPTSTFGMQAGITFGLVMGVLVFAASILDSHVHLALRTNKATPVSWQLTAVMLIYVAMPSAAICVAHFILPSVIVIARGIWSAISLIWMPLFLASLLQFKQRIDKLN